MGSYFSADVLCPFYLHDNLRECTITCESFAPGSTIKNHFGGKAALRKQIEKYCAGDYGSCPWYKLVSQKYE